jgi:hypothetical protein
MPLPGESNPRVVFERLFGEGTSNAERRERNQTRRSILDLVSEDLSRLKHKLGARDAILVDDYLASVRDVEKRLERADKANAEQPDSLDRPRGIPAKWEDHTKLLFDLLVLAYRADVTRVSTYQITRELSVRSYPEIGVNEGHHDCSHHANNPAKVASYTKIGTYHMSLFAYFLQQLRNTPDGDGTLLDHSLMLYGSGLGDGDLHSPHDLEIVLAGSGCGTVKPGRYVRYKLDTPMMNLGLTLLDKLGAAVDGIGDSTGRLADI